jgi:hypothetical protein
VRTACSASRTVHSLQDIFDKLTNHEDCHYAVCSILLLRPVTSWSLTCLLHKSEYEVGTPTKRLTDSSDRALHSSCHFHDGKADCVIVPLVAYSVFVHPQWVFIDHKLLNVAHIRSKQVKLLYQNTTYQLMTSCCILSFGWFPGVWILCANVLEHTVPSS